MRLAIGRLTDRHPILVYTVARVGLLLAAMLLLAAIGFRGVALFGLAILLSGAVSLFALDGARGRFSGRMSGYFARINKRIDDAARAEDDDEPSEPVRTPTSADQRQPEA